MCNIFLDLFPAIFTDWIGKASPFHPLTRYFVQLTTQVVHCPLPGKFPLMQAWQLLTGRIAQKFNGKSIKRTSRFLIPYNVSINPSSSCSVPIYSDSIGRFFLFSIVSVTRYVFTPRGLIERSSPTSFPTIRHSAGSSRNSSRIPLKYSGFGLQYVHFSYVVITLKSSASSPAQRIRLRVAHRGKTGFVAR